MINTILVEDDMYIRKHFEDMLAADGRFYIAAAVPGWKSPQKLHSESGG